MDYQGTRPVALEDRLSEIVAENERIAHAIQLRMLRWKHIVDQMSAGIEEVRAMLDPAPPAARSSELTRDSGLGAGGSPA